MTTWTVRLVALLMPFIAALRPAIAGSLSRSSIDLAGARAVLSEARAISERDAGRLWGVSLLGPILLVDAATRSVVANEPDGSNVLVGVDGVFFGELPESILVANTAVDWAGKRWTMYRWPLPSDSVERADLLAHELFHRVQERIGLRGTMPGANSHLDTLAGRLWLRLEWRALASALQTHGQGRVEAARHALLFRAQRRRLLPGAAGPECALETHEGLAAYTGARLSGAADIERYAADLLKRHESDRSYVQSFAYASGPAYSLLLDGAGTEWRKGLKAGDDLGEILRRALDITTPSNLEAEARRAMTLYDGPTLESEETRRDSERRARIAEYRRRLVESPVLDITVGPDKRMGYNPNNLISLDDLGTVYPTLTVSGRWGTIRVEGAALFSADFARVRVPAPADLAARPLKGDGWTLELTPGWSVGPGPRQGDVSLIPPPSQVR